MARHMERKSGAGSGGRREGKMGRENWFVDKRCWLLEKNRVTVGRIGLWAGEIVTVVWKEVGVYLADFPE